MQIVDEGIFTTREPLPKILVIDYEPTLYMSLSEGLRNEASVIMSSSSSYKDFIMMNSSAPIAPPEYASIIVNIAVMPSLSYTSHEGNYLCRPRYAIHQGAAVDTCFIAVYAPEAGYQPMLRDILFANMKVNMVGT